MDDAALTTMLGSGDSDIVLDALSHLGARRDAVPSDEIFRMAIAHFRHPDPDVRREAVFAVGVHWAFPPAFAELVLMIRAEHDDYVAGTVVSAVSRMAREDPALERQAIEELASTGLDENRSLELRKQAFVEVRWLLRVTDEATYASEALSSSEVQIDVDWLRDLVSDSARTSS